MAGRVKEKYPGKVEVETVYSGFLGFGHREGEIKPPNIAVNGKLLGSEPAYEDVEKAVIEKLS